MFRDLLFLRRAQSRERGRLGDRHGQGSDAQQQGKEEAKGRQEPQKGRRRAGQSVRGGEDPGPPKAEQQEELRVGGWNRLAGSGPSPLLVGGGGPTPAL